MNGKNYKLNIPLPLKIILLILISNLFFYFLFFPADREVQTEINEDLIELKVDAKLMTSFHIRKEVTLHHSLTNKNIDALLISPPDEEGLITIATDIESGKILLTSSNWRIIPPIKLNVSHLKGESREIKY